MSDVENSDSARFSIVEVIDGFIDKINQIRKTLIGISVSALILAPLAIGLSVYLITHQHFYFILDEYDEFGLFLAILLGIIITVSLTWLILGIRQYIMLKSWNSRYFNYTRKKEQVDSKIGIEFDLDEDQQT